IKETLSDANHVALHLTPSTSQEKDSKNYPFEDSNISYKLDVYEIKNGHNSGWGFDGAISLEIESKTDRFLDPNYLSVGSLVYQYEENQIHVTYKIRREITIQISNPLHIIPEVRAGPIS
ncbi:hypothetical protein, partial [Algibacter sp.]|uniref:hypothetical protein n=1 Tax=Algibacter sp. TaxID=1872428 RepID=UPI003C75C1C8